MKMIVSHLFAAIVPTVTQKLRRKLFRLGGVGLIPLALLDNSPIPLPGIVDVATIVMAARNEQWWLYYGLMATAGSLLGGFVTYWLARKGGREALERRFSHNKVVKLCDRFRRWGFGAVAIPAILPPPIPMVPFLFAAGAMQYPAKKFLAALTLGRTLRYLILAYLAAVYGRYIVTFVAGHEHPVIVGAVLAALVAAVAILFVRYGHKIDPREKTANLPLKLGRRPL